MRLPYAFFFFFNDTATTEIYTLSLHDALPICRRAADDDEPYRAGSVPDLPEAQPPSERPPPRAEIARSEEHTSELQSPCNLVCRLLLEKKKRPPASLPLLSRPSDLSHCPLSNS